MTWLEEIRTSLYALTRLIRLDPETPRYFNLTAQGFWRSFVVSATLILCIEVLQILVLQRSPGASEILNPSPGVILGSIPNYLLLILYPLIMIPLTKVFDLAENYVTFIIVWNWMTAMNFIVAAIIFIPAILFSVPLDQFTTLLIIINLTMISYAVYLTKLALQCNFFTAIGFIVLDILMGHLLGELF